MNCEVGGAKLSPETIGPWQETFPGVVTTPRWVGKHLQQERAKGIEPSTSSLGS